MNMINQKGMKRLLLATIALTPFVSQDVSAQSEASSSAPSDAPQTSTGAGLGDIVVTARKRDETSIAVPVSITAVGQQELVRRGINGLDAVARVVPQLVIAENGGSAQGGTIALRGITGPDSNVFGDQAVSFNIDGVQVAKSSIRRLGQIDLAQIEVLKGPQALFFGKNSPGGVISIRSADPTDKFEAKASLGYEFNAQEWRGEGYVSGPVTDSLGLRLAGYFSDMRGWVENTFPTGTPISPAHKWGPHSNEVGLRGTAKFDSGGPLTARLKVSYGRTRGSGTAVNFQPISCPVGGVPQLASPSIPAYTDDCKPNSKISHADMGTSFTPFEPGFGDGQSRGHSEQWLAGLELNYSLSDALQLTSVTGFYHVDAEYADHFGYSAPEALLPSYTTFGDREVSQELRLASSFDTPLNFTVGGIYSNTRGSASAHTLFGTRPPATTAFGTPAPSELNDYYFTQKGEAYSFFGQLMWKVVPSLELAAGGRYSHESKRLPKVLADLGSLFDPAAPGRDPTLAIPDPQKISFNDFSPEITATWRPTQQLTVYGSYKRGFLSGGFNSSSDGLLPGARIDYGPQKVRGFEGGIKSSLLDNNLRLNLAVYSYNVLGLQVNSFEAGVSSIRNAGKVGIKGAEFDFNYRTPLDGLTLRGGVAYNHARYKQYTAPCYVGQTQAMGCTLNIVGGVGTVQDLAGTPAPNAPNWIVNGGFNYETPVGSALKLGLSSDLNFSSSYVTDSKNSPNSRPPAQALLDASVRVGSNDDRWEVALIGRNLTNRYYWNNSQDLFPSGFGTGGGAGTVGILSDRFAVVSRAREVMLRVSVKY